MLYIETSHLVRTLRHNGEEMEDELSRKAE